MMPWPTSVQGHSLSSIEVQHRRRLRHSVGPGPPLLKAYLRAGAKFGDSAVINAQFGTTDVFIILPLSYLSHYGGPMEMPDSYVA